ncbi:glycosyltransferase [Rothia sp. ZJ932]|uniref:glycosyltransferase family protein n=1 Tax=Rothia sp. ZJ932 TaxID=2810516 RepID=UPI0019683B92|nr:glycosyltransferase [Rothia sp. ZJ932]QRZ61211.1 glycosyltransferase [Rothia sp. ZJ932]
MKKRDTYKCLVLTKGSAHLGPYGIDKLKNFDFEITEKKPAEHKLHVKIRDFFEHRYNTPIDKTIRSLFLAYQSDVVLAFLENEALFASWMKSKGIKPYADKPLAVLVCWLADDLEKMSPSQAQKEVRKYSGVDLFFVFSQNQVEILARHGIPKDKIKSVNFGFAPGLFSTRNFHLRSGNMVAVGVDRGRDYNLLVNALKGTDIIIDLYTKPEVYASLPQSSQIIFKGLVTYDKYREILATAKAVIIPSKLMAYPSGQTVAIEAGGTGAPVLISQTPALSQYFNSTNSLQYTPGDEEDLREQLIRMDSDDALRESLSQEIGRDMHSNFTYEQMWQTISSEILNLLNKKR